MVQDMNYLQLHLKTIHTELFHKLHRIHFDILDNNIR